MKAGHGIALAAVLAISAFGVSAGASAGDGSHQLQAKKAAAAKGKRACRITSREEGESLGASYVDVKIKTRGVRCGKAKRVIKSFNKCRKRHGGADGRCPKREKVRGFRCKEGKRVGVKGVTYHADVKCKRGPKRIKFGYTQNL